MQRVHSFIHSFHCECIVHIPEMQKKKQQERGIETVLALAVLDCFSFVKFSFAKNHVSSRTGRHTATNLLLTGCRSSCSIQPSSIPVLLFCAFSPPLLTQFKSVSCSSISSANTMTQCICREIKIMMLNSSSAHLLSHTLCSSTSTAIPVFLSSSLAWFRSPPAAWLRTPTISLFFLFLSNCDVVLFSKALFLPFFVPCRFFFENKIIHEWQTSTLQIFSFTAFAVPAKLYVFAKQKNYSHHAQIFIFTAFARSTYCSW